MSTHFSGEGNIGSPPEYREFPNGNDEPSRLLRLNVYFDNPIPKKDGTFEDRGGFWAPVEIWHRDAAHAESDRMRSECDLYVDTKLAEFEEFLTGTVRSVGRGRQQLRTGSGVPDYQDDDRRSERRR